jgi:hypothetical protein
MPEYEINPWALVIGLELALWLALEMVVRLILP